MVELIIQILAVTNIITILVMFIGYWTYADYYTNMDGSNRYLYWLITGFTLGICIECAIIADHEKLLTMLTRIFAVQAALIISYFVLSVIIINFVKSRKYFGQKRNKL